MRVACTPRAWRRGSSTSASGARTCSTACAARSRSTGDAALAALYDEVQRLPGAAEPTPGHDAGGEVSVPLRLPRADDRELRFFSTVATFGTAVDITVAELAIESFFPADAATAEALRGA